MPKKSSDFEFRQQASLSQRLGFAIPDLQELAGVDPKTSLQIQRIKECIREGILDKDDKMIQFVLKIKNGDRLALLATSERFNEISKMGLMLPAKEEVYRDE